MGLFDRQADLLVQQTAKIIRVSHWSLERTPDVLARTHASIENSRKQLNDAPETARPKRRSARSR